jgi:uncharacterized protein (DUF2384 family)
VNVAQQLSQALQRQLEHQQALAKQLNHIDEELAAAALDTFESPVGAAQWLTTALSVLGDEKTPLELSKTPDGKAACLQALGRLNYGNY